MKASLVTPTDPEFGLPLLIAPNLDKTPDRENWHHDFHPSNDPRLAHSIQNLGGWALRNCRLQLVDEDYHNFGPAAYHEHYLGPPIPDDEREQFRLVVLACAGLIPRQGMDFSSGNPQIVDLNDEQLKALRTEKPNQRFGYSQIRFIHDPVWQFLTDFTMRQTLSDVQPSLIEEFLDRATRHERRMYLGHLLLSKQVDIATDSVTGQYDQAKRAGMLDPRVQYGPRDFIKHRILGRRIRQEAVLFPRLASRLKAELGAA